MFSPPSTNIFLSIPPKFSETILIMLNFSVNKNTFLHIAIHFYGVPLRTKIRRIIFYSKSNVSAVEVEY